MFRLDPKGRPIVTTLLTIIHFASCALLWFLVPIFIVSGPPSLRRTAAFTGACLILIAASMLSAQSAEERWHFLFFPFVW